MTRTETSVVPGMATGNLEDGSQTTWLWLGPDHSGVWPGSSARHHGSRGQLGEPARSGETAPRRCEALRLSRKRKTVPAPGPGAREWHASTPRPNEPLFPELKRVDEQHEVFFRHRVRHSRHQIVVQRHGKFPAGHRPGTSRPVPEPAARRAHRGERPPLQTGLPSGSSFTSSGSSPNKAGLAGTPSHDCGSRRLAGGGNTGEAGGKGLANGREGRNAVPCRSPEVTGTP